MDTDLVLDTGKFISSKRASELSGYAQDYIGQLARSTQVEARRIGGLWYVSMDSIMLHKNKSDELKPKPPANEIHVQDVDAFVNFDGKEYISANRASKITGYNQDYIGQLARGGKIISRQVGNRWYIDKEALLAHKGEKDALLAAVQVESVGVKDTNSSVLGTVYKKMTTDSLLKYTNDNGDLLPILIDKDSGSVLGTAGMMKGSGNVVPIRIVGSNYNNGSRYIGGKELVSLHGKTISRAAFPVLLITIVIVLSFGLFSLKKDSLYTSINSSQSQSATIVKKDASVFVASASRGFSSLVAFMEEILTTELIYERVH